MDIDYNHVFRAHHAFAETGGRNQHPVLIQPDRKISIRRGHESHTVKHLAKVGKVPAQLAFRASCLAGKWSRGRFHQFPEIAHHYTFQSLYI
jgi:hypothetical protein